MRQPSLRLCLDPRCFPKSQRFTGEILVHFVEGFTRQKPSPIHSFEAQTNSEIPGEMFRLHDCGASQKKRRACIIFLLALGNYRMNP
jgi:hypothetical protein